MITLKTKFDQKSQLWIRTVQTASGGKLRIFGDLSMPMLILGEHGVNVVKQRVEKGIGSDDRPMSALKPSYQRFKQRRSGREPIRNLTLSGRMLDNFTVRSVSDREVRMDITGSKERIKARANERRAAWFGWSPRDLASIITVARRAFHESVESARLVFRGIRSRPESIRLGGHAAATDALRNKLGKAA